MIETTFHNLGGFNIFEIVGVDCKGNKLDLSFVKNGETITFYDCKTKSSPVQNTHEYKVINNVLIST